MSKNGTIRRDRMNWASTKLLCLAILVNLQAGTLSAYDYSEPMPCVDRVPLGYPESPFVLRFSSEELRRQPIWSTQVDAIVISGNAGNPVRIGAEALRAMLVSQRLGQAKVVELDHSLNALPSSLERGNVIVLGTPGAFSLVSKLVGNAGLEVTDQVLNGDGFIIKPLQHGHQHLLLITAALDRGVLYGAYEVEERISRRGVPRIDDRDIPAVRYRNWPIHLLLDPPTEMAGRWRLNTVIVPNNITFSGNRSAFLYPGFPELGCERNRTTILADEKFMHEQFAAMAKFGGVKMMMWNPLMLPIHSMDDRHSVSWSPGSAKFALEKKYPGILAQPWDNPFVDSMGPNRYCLCPSHPMTKRYVEDGARELVRTFPEVDVLIIQLSDGGGELFCGCDKCQKYPYMDRVVDYAKLVMDTIHREKPAMKFIFSACWEWKFIPLYNQKYRDDPTGGMMELKKRLGPDVIAFLTPPSAPPLGDQRGWLAPDSTFLGHNLPLYEYFFWYEIWGIGIARPLSPIATHLSWVLPIDLQKLRKFTANGQMVGAMSPNMGMEVGYWHPEIDAQEYLRNWCIAKYGEKAGGYVFEALKDTYKVTEGLLPNTKRNASESVSLYRWGEYRKPWAESDMNEWWEKVSEYKFRTGKYDLALLEINVPQAPKPAELRNITPNELDKWLKRFELSRETDIATRSETMLAKAVGASPNNREIWTLHEIAKGTVYLVNLYKEYHRAFVYASLARNLPPSATREEYLRSARVHLRGAILKDAEYNKCYLPIAGLDKSYMPVKTLYIPFLAMEVREACFLFDREFGGASMLAEMNKVFGMP
jgi:hypothetical protein